MKVSELSKSLNATVIGNEDLEIKGISDLQLPKENHLCFLFSKAFRSQLDLWKNACVITDQPLTDTNLTQLIVKRPRLALSKCLEILYPSYLGIAKSNAAENHNQAQYFVGKNSTLGKNTKLYHNVSIGSNCKIGNNCILFPGVVLYDNVQIGDNVIIHSNTVIGSDGFGYQMADGKWHKTLHIGSVVIEDDVEIGANCTIDRGCLGVTLIKSGSKIDNLVQISHNTTIGKHCAITAQVGLAGRAKLGDYVSIGGQAGLLDIEVEDHVTIASRSVVTKSVSKGQVVSGNPAIDHKVALKKTALLNKFLKKLEKKEV